MKPGLEILTHGQVRLPLYTLQRGEGRPLLLLHGLGEAAPKSVPESVAAWPGPVRALDFTGHGKATVPRGGGYTPEILVADADAALGSLGEATVLGRGLGAYVALLLAGCRPRLVRGAILCDGPGLNGGSSSFDGTDSRREPPAGCSATDPFALAELATDVRPPGYARLFVRQARHLAGLEHPITVSAIARPEWLEAVAAAPGVAVGSLAEAFERYAG